VAVKDVNYLGSKHLPEGQAIHAGFSAERSAMLAETGEIVVK
jgi:hypothetical protein